MDEQTETIGGNGSNTGISLIDLLEAPEMPIDTYTESPQKEPETSPAGSDDDSGNNMPAADPSQADPAKPLISTDVMYMVTTRGLTILHNPERIREYTAKMMEGELNDYIIFPAASPALMFIQNDAGTISPMVSPTDIKTTSTRLYAMAVTYRSTITRLVRRHLRKNQDAISRTSKLVWVIALCVITLAIIFMLGIVATDSGGSSSDDDVTQQGVQVNPSGQQPNLELSPEPTGSVTKQDDSRVYVPPAGANQ